ncbi:hypothetical protein BJ508DRAFT_144760 [Ascobolus immersus RN42]|uniref:F-box domain-containing protein n=1 Tax=Ascobolus immersus RN42 TaxID=1160509 RepID=A0A3N4HZS8_ASCIM|nr:hypothetical protein BJ508DRAFT_144760 [Ascobolus immersus RN42]
MTDPVRTLPPELLTAIFCHLPPNCVFTLRRVSRQWDCFLSSQPLASHMHRNLPFASTASDLESRLKRRARLNACDPVSIARITSKSYPGTRVRDARYSRGLLAIVWQNNARFKLEVWNLAKQKQTGSANGTQVNGNGHYDFPQKTKQRKPAVSIDLQDLFPCVRQYATERLTVDMELEGESKVLVLQLQLSGIKCWAVLDCITGEVLQKWEHDLDSDAGRMGRPLLRSNGEILLCVALAGRSATYGGRMGTLTWRKIAIVYSVRTGEEICRDYYEDFQFCRRHDKSQCAVVDSMGNCYLALQDKECPFLEVFNPLLQNGSVRKNRIPLASVFATNPGTDEENVTKKQFYEVNIEPVGDSVYCTAYYNSAEDSNAKAVRAFVKLPMRLFALASHQLSLTNHSTPTNGHTNGHLVSASISSLSSAPPSSPPPSVMDSNGSVTTKVSKFWKAALTKNPLLRSHYSLSPPLVLQTAVNSFSSDPLTLGYWGYASDIHYDDQRFQISLFDSLPSDSSSTRTSNGLATPTTPTSGNIPVNSMGLPAASNTRIKSHPARGYERFQNTPLAEGDDGVLLLKSRDVRKPEWYVLVFDEDWEVPEECGLAVEVDELEAAGQR